MLLATDGYLYGTTEFGGNANYGVLFRITPNGNLTVLHDFSGGPDGDSPTAPPVEASDGNLYGTTADSGNSTVYEYSQSGTFSTLHNFKGLAGKGLFSPLIQGSDGNLFGTTRYAQISGGTVFEMTRTGTILHSYGFPGQPSGYWPYGPVMQASDGNYGTDSAGGANCCPGTVYQINPQWVVSTIHDFSIVVPDGENPYAGLIEATDGNLNGSTIQRELGGTGELFQVKLDGSYTYTDIYNFPAYANAYYPYGLVQHTSGDIYGITKFGGTNNLGTVFSLDMGLGPFIALVRCTGRIGQPVQILGQGLTGSTAVTINGIAATSFKVVSDTYMTAVVPAAATTGPVVVTTATGTLTSNHNFQIVQ